jgi:vanillate O-demethylase monooxygenase subunit
MAIGIPRREPLEATVTTTEGRPSTTTTNKVLGHPLNAWYVAAWDHEVTGKSLFPRKVANRPLVMYRTDDGRPVALADACWHRLAPLSMGKRVGSDEVQCPYHGLRYNSAGRCTFMLAQKTINPSAMVPSFPVVERHRFVWVWLGDPTLADPDTVPDMHQMDPPDRAGDVSTIHVGAK